MIRVNSSRSLPDRDRHTQHTSLRSACQADAASLADPNCHSSISTEVVCVIPGAHQASPLIHRRPDVHLRRNHSFLSTASGLSYGTRHPYTCIRRTATLIPEAIEVEEWLMRTPDFELSIYTGTSAIRPERGHRTFPPQTAHDNHDNRLVFKPHHS